MAYEVLARKWRPRQFDDVVGQGHVTQTLKNAIESDRIAHAYLFVGPRGIGKTSVARIFAKALNCEKGPAVSPCDVCDACREIATGSSLDVLEIDGASNNGVEQVRELRETVKYAPARGRFKIFIIDEVHMLSTAAFNALLKTLEEPPPHVKFMFATTEPQKILATIISRCQRFDLRRIPVPQIIERLKLIAKAEKVKIDDDALLAIARGAEGGLRDAESALDQLVSFRGTTIGEPDVLAVFGLVSRAALEALAEALLKGDVKRLLGTVAELDAAGKDLQRLVIELMDYFRNLLVCLYVDTGLEDLDLTPAQVEVLRAQAELTDAARALRIVGILSETADRMKHALSRRTVLETALIRAARAASVVSLEQLLRRIQELQEGPVGVSPAVGGSAAARPVAAVERPAGDPPAPGPRRDAAPAQDAAEAVANEEQMGKDLDALTRGWDKVVEKIIKVAPLLRSVLVDVRPLRVEKDRVVLGCDAEFAEELGRFDVARNRRAVEHVIGSALGRKIAAVFETCAADAAGAGPAAREDGPSHGAGGECGDAPAEAKPAGRGKRHWAEDQTVKKALKVFQGSIVDVRE